MKLKQCKLKIKEVVENFFSLLIRDQIQSLEHYQQVFHSFWLKKIGHKIFRNRINSFMFIVFIDCLILTTIVPLLGTAQPVDHFLSLSVLSLNGVSRSWKQKAYKVTSLMCCHWTMKCVCRRIVPVDGIYHAVLCPDRHSNCLTTMELLKSKSVYVKEEKM